MFRQQGGVEGNVRSKIECCRDVWAKNLRVISEFYIHVIPNAHVAQRSKRFGTPLLSRRVHKERGSKSVVPLRYTPVWNDGSIVWLVATRSIFLHPHKQKRPAEAGRSVIQAKLVLEAPDGDCVHNGLLRRRAAYDCAKGVQAISNILVLHVRSFQAQGEL